MCLSKKITILYTNTLLEFFCLAWDSFSSKNILCRDIALKTLKKYKPPLSL